MEEVEQEMSLPNFQNENAPASSERKEKRVRTTWRFQPRSHRAEDEANAPASSERERE